MEGIIFVDKDVCIEKDSPYSISVDRIKNIIDGVDLENFDWCGVYHNNSLHINEESLVEGKAASASIPCVRIAPNKYPRKLCFGENICVSWFTAPRFDFSFPPQEVETRGFYLISEAVKDFNKISSSVPIEPQDIINLLEPPTEEDEKGIKDAMPPTRGIKEHLRFWRAWIIEKMLGYPGPLMNSRRCATRLGISETHFEDIKSNFRKYRYDGAFSCYTREQWWINGIISEIGRNTTNKGNVKCEVCGKIGADRCAEFSIDKNKNVLVPVHYSCSQVKKTRRDPYSNHRIIETQMLSRR